MAKTITTFALLTVCLFWLSCVTLSMTEQHFVVEHDTELEEGDVKRELLRRRKRGRSGGKRKRWRKKQQAHWGHGRCEFVLSSPLYDPSVTLATLTSRQKKGAIGKNTDRRETRVERVGGKLLPPSPGRMTGTGTGTGGTHQRAPRKVNPSTGGTPQRAPRESKSFTQVMELIGGIKPRIPGSNCTYMQLNYSY